jgi:hypothetical protein
MEQQEPQKRQWRWPVARMTRAAFLYGMGWTPEDIASDLFIQSTPASVRRALRRAGVWDGTSPPGRFRIDLARRHIEPLREAAQRRHTTTEKLLGRVAELLAEDPVLLENILDDAEA